MIYKVLYILRKIYWYIFRPKTTGIKVLLIKYDKVLLVKTRYTDYYSIPGGGVDKNESPVDGAKREIKEEIGLKLGALNLFSTYESIAEGKRDTVHVYTTSEFDENVISLNEREIGEYRMSGIEEALKDEEVSPATKRRLNEYLGRKEITKVW